MVFSPHRKLNRSWKSSTRFVIVQSHKRGLFVSEQGQLEGLSRTNRQSGYARLREANASKGIWNWDLEFENGVGPHFGHNGSYSGQHESAYFAKTNAIAVTFTPAGDREFVAIFQPFPCFAVGQF